MGKDRRDDLRLHRNTSLYTLLHEHGESFVEDFEVDLYKSLQVFLKLKFVTGLVNICLIPDGM